MILKANSPIRLMTGKEAVSNALPQAPRPNASDFQSWMVYRDFLLCPHTSVPVLCTALCPWPPPFHQHTAAFLVSSVVHAHFPVAMKPLLRVEP